MRSEQQLDRFTVDSAVDDAAGSEHLFQVLRNWATDRQPHPHDIHQILAHHQGAPPVYELTV